MRKVGRLAAPEDHSFWPVRGDESPRTGQKKGYLESLQPSKPSTSTPIA
jgi:hypothetical protein